MSKTRNNHYVPQWHQAEFFEPSRNTLSYLDMTPPTKTLDNGRVIAEKALFNAPTSRAFQQRDLYSTFFGAFVNDEIERYLFGDIDARGAKAIRAYAEEDARGWHRHFKNLFEYLDIQKIRTPKGLDWLRSQYPLLNQNELMMEMQGIRMMHCTIWAQGVREIVSAEESGTKFIVSDHPVTIYNYAVDPQARECAYPNDPSIAQKASQTIFPLSRNFCLILTNLEYARDPSTNPLEKRTFARNFRMSITNAVSFIRKRKLSSQEVAQINLVIKRRARRYIAAGRKEWLYPEKSVSETWGELRTTLLPPKNELWHFGGEMFVKYEDGHVHYQDEFGRTEKPRDFLRKEAPAKALRPKDSCGCGYGRNFAECCMPKPVALRPAWNEPSIRERNIMLYNAIVSVLELGPGKSWVQVRRELTDEKISKIYFLYQGLWPLETDILSLLPKPDGIARAVYTGSIHPHAIADFAIGASLYFGDLLIEHPFMHAGALSEQYNPVKNPGAYRQEFLKSVVFFLEIMPLVEAGFVNLVPDAGAFDIHLRDQTMHMAKSRSAGINVDIRHEPRVERLMKADSQRSMMSMPSRVLKAQIQRSSPQLDETAQEEVLRHIERLRVEDPLASLQEPLVTNGRGGGLLTAAKLAPNFEMTMYLAQATGACIVTDSFYRWAEIKRACQPMPGERWSNLTGLSERIESAKFAFPQEASDIVELSLNEDVAAYRQLLRDTSQYMSRVSSRGNKTNREAQFAGQFARIHRRAQAGIRKRRLSSKEGRITCAFPSGGIQDNNINRLLLMSSSEHHLPYVPMAFFIEGANGEA